MRSLGMFLDGNAAEIRDEQGAPVNDEDFFLLLNGHWEPVDFTLPRKLRSGSWRLAFDTNRPQLEPGAVPVDKKVPVRLEGRSLVVLCHARA